ncbi:MAG: hypothetical protein DRP01_06545 [Archaeoglobales archaeon]|nr:MAG: hypothetical protein DRP01_06545 [Archaeoglobales archaeon]
MVDWFIALPKPVKQFIAVIIVLIALLGPIIGLLTTLGPLLGAIGIGGTAAAGGITVLGVSLGTLIPVIGLVIVAIALLYVAWVNNWGGIQDITYGAIDAISEGINTFVEIMTETWETGLALIKAIWAGDWQEVENILLDIFGRLPGPLADFAELGLGIIKDMMGAIVAIFSGDWDKAAEYMAKAMEKIQELILNLGKWMYEAGKNLINSLVQGIQDAVAAAGDALSEAAEGVSDYFGGSLPEKGPLKNIYRYGQELAEFYAAGISKGLSRVESQLSVNISIPTAVGTTYNVYKLEPKIEMVNNTAVTPYDLKSMLTQIFEELLSDYHRRAY